MTKLWSEYTETELNDIITKGVGVRKLQQESASEVEELLIAAVTTRFHLTQGGFKVGKTYEQMKGLVTDLMDHGLDEEAKRLISRHGIRDYRPRQKTG